MFNVSAQTSTETQSPTVEQNIVIGGNVYGGGKSGKMTGSTNVTIYAGDFKDVYGGAQQADVEGRTFVHLDGEHASDDIFCVNVYGGNDIAGRIGEGTATTTIPDELENVWKTTADDNDKTKNKIDDTWKTFVRTSACKEKTPSEYGQYAGIDTKMLVVASLFGGSNGDYNYEDETISTTDPVTRVETTKANPYYGMVRPDITKTYLEIKGGCLAHVYGGGNNATVTEATTINIDNSSDHLEKGAIVFASKHPEITNVIDYFKSKVNMPTFQAKLDSWAFNHARIFGGNNKATMEIMPKWNLQKGIIRDLFSGGNEGAMICKNGLLLVIDPAVDLNTGNKEGLEIVNVYGGCRLADVRPMEKITTGANIGQYEDVTAYSPEGYKFPAGLSARTLVYGGKIHNVYGGNDISGKVYGGNAVGIYSSILGDVYGGGNGSYAYTDNSELAKNEEYKDFYYDPGSNSVAALNAFRPNAEQVSIRLAGKDKNHPVIIYGRVFVGGNSATLHAKDGVENPMVELKIGSNVIANNVFLGNNGENMIKYEKDEDVLKIFSSQKEDKAFSTLNLKDADTFAKYMDGCAMSIMPSVVFDTKPKDPDDYIKYSSYFGSFFCGGNVGSMKKVGLTTINFTDKVVIFDKLVGGCNTAFVEAGDLNAGYEGGLIDDPDANGNKLTLNLSGLRLRPMRWKVQRAQGDYATKVLDANGDVQYELDTNGNPQLEWNTVDASTGKETAPLVGDDQSGNASQEDLDRRFTGGSIYGGCYTSGIVNGNVVINVDSTLVERDLLFDKVKLDGFGEEESLYGDNQATQATFTFDDSAKRRSGVILAQQGMDVLGKALNIFGGGKGKSTEIWGSTTINLNGGYIFQVFGGSEEGIIGKPEIEDGTVVAATAAEGTYENSIYSFNGRKYQYNPAYSCYVNLCGESAGVSKHASQDENMSECEFLYGGGFLGPICGNTVINMGNGRIFNSFAGSCNADILGHAETYIGRQVQDDHKSLMGSLGSVETNGVSLLDSDDSDLYEAGFPWVRDITYGGNDLGGIIYGKKCFLPRVRPEVLGLVHNPVPTGTSEAPAVPKVLTTSAYTEYLQGRADAIFGGCYGTYDYSESRFAGVVKPFMEDAFVNFRPTYNNSGNMVNSVFGAGEGIYQNIDTKRDGDKLQNGSYVLVDVPSDIESFNNTEFFGGGSFNGLGMTYNYSNITDNDQLYEALPENFDIDEASAIIDLARGKVGNVYGGSYNEGIVRRSMINVPEGSTINVNNIFGGGFGADINIPCDVIETQVNYHSATATVRNNLYGGNNNADRTLYGQVNITKPVWQDEENGYLATVYGAGRGVGTWSEYTEVNLLPGAKVFEVYGGGENGRVINAQTLNYWQEADPLLDLTLHGYLNVGLADPLAKETALGGKYNTNVHIHKGALVYNYAYGGGLGDKNIANSGDVYGTTYIDLLGGTVNKDIYAAGTTGSVMDYYKVGAYDASSNPNGFTAGTTAYVAGGTCRNVYGGGWKGSVGKHTKMVNNVEVAADIYDDATHDISGESHVVIGVRKDQTEANLLASIRKVLGESATLADYGFYCGQPTIQRNAYGGGEGGAIYGKANLTLNNGYIGYDYDAATKTYREKIDDETYYDAETGVDGTGRLRDCGNVFGGGYDARSSVDETNIVMWNGMVRGSLHGGGEIATIGRGSTKEGSTANSERTFKEIYKGGKTFVDMYNGHVLRNVYAGGKGYNLLGYGSASELYTDGYVFGSTEAHIHGGEIGTEEGLRDYGYGNVFGGGDLGYVYSSGFDSDKTKAGKDAGTTTGSPGHYYYYDNEGHLTKDCEVLVSPYLQLKEGQSVEYEGKTYYAYDYVPTDYLNTLPAKNNDGTWGGGWQNLITEDESGERGVLIHNAVFAGGNVATNSDTHYANATTIFGNTVASLYDVFYRDFITVGTEHTGGIYGGGNLSVVDGYRELNITNYGTDYYGLQERISLDEYHHLSNRERAYFKLEYLCVQDNGSYTVGNKISEEEYNKLDAQYKNTTYWEQYGFCSIYAGRLLNTIQRADLCGVYGSRMVLQGAKDRVADVGEKVDYTINRVGELSLNKSMSGSTTHGNYFGIYSLVNHLGNLTSDVRFVSNYVDENGVEHNDKTYYSYKEPQPTGNWRNRGTSHNEVALASGVYLELTTENSTPEKKDYGLITGIIELDLINVKKDIVGGGYVYARNEHRLPVYYDDMEDVVLSEFNKEKEGVRAAAKTYKRYRYSADAPGNWPNSDGYVAPGGEAYQEKEIQTSGNFIHKKKRIVDDCYPTNNRYAMDDPERSPAHYWYIKGSVYIYDQVVSAYTGSAAAYSKEVHLPLTITASSGGRLKLLNVKPNLYAYYYENGKKIGTGANADEGKVWVNREADSYELNDVITWWDWQNLSDYEQSLFVKETCVNAVPCIIDGKSYDVGEYVILPDDKSSMQSHTITDATGNAIVNKEGTVLEGENLVNEVFRSSNNVGGDTGYVLTLDMDTPGIWDDYHTKTIDPETGQETISTSDYKGLTDNDQKAYTEGPTFSPINNLPLGKRYYTIGQIITKEEYDLIPDESVDRDAHKASIDEAYVAKYAVTYTFSGQTKTVNAGTAIPETEWSTLSETEKNAFDEAYVCTSTVKVGDDDYLVIGDLMTYNDYQNASSDVQDAFTPAYICKETGTYGGRLYAKNTNYSAIQSWCALSADDREKFTFNYDALNLFADPNYSVETPDGWYRQETSGGKTTWQAYDGLDTEDESKKVYSKEVGVEYVAVFKAPEGVTGLPYYDGETMSNTVFEQNVRNDKRYYTSVSSTADVYTRTDNKKVFYVATNNFIYDGEPFGIGQVVSKDVYDHRTDVVEEVEVHNDMTDNQTFYYCYETHNEGGTEVGKGTQINSSAYSSLIDYQQYFVIQGQEPTETTTLYVNRESDIKDVTKEKVISVVYQYTYYETDDNGDIRLTNELHVINVHLQLESGAPTIGPLEDPPTVLPGNTIGLKTPTVTPGLYEPLTNGWELFSNKDDADHHRNGVPFTNNGTPVYWYQNKDHYLAFYSKTYLGKTYSNYVPISVANYHDLADVMERHKDNHLYIERSDVDRPCLVYINDYSSLPDDDVRKGKNGLDELRRLFDLTVLNGSPVENLDANGLMTTGDFQGHAPLQGDHIKGCNNLEIILRNDVDRTKPAGDGSWTPWVPVGDDTNCFAGNLHGDGHTVSGLETSLFGKLCGSVYNLGVTGSFTSAGVADTGDGFVENCWIKTSATTGFTGSTQPVFGAPTTDGCTHVVNCYYPEAPVVPVAPVDPEAPEAPSPVSPYYDASGPATMMPDKAFYDGTVAYNLNGFYLGKRYYDGSGLAAGENNTGYDFITANADGTLPMNATATQNVATTAYYPTDRAYYTPESTTLTPKLGYVEHRFYDGDFRYANGDIPDTYNVRRQENEVTINSQNTTVVTWVPIWPDDYLFFGQTLTYGYVDGRTHQETPSAISKNGDRLLLTEASNRVYRAPAYFRNSTMQTAHFNPYAVFAKQNAAGTIELHKNMTAIDFTGGNGDVTGAATDYKQGQQGTTFYPPVLDDDGLTGFKSVGLTKNLLAYTFTGTDAARKTDEVVMNAITDFDYAEGTASGNGYVPNKEAYRTVAEWDRNFYYNMMTGHWVQGNDDRSAYTAQTDHFLVDKEDFNAPIAYAFDDDHRMWHQRKPDNYVENVWVDHDNDDSTPNVRTTTGWEHISLPFKVDIVTTQQKGEITHFYNTSKGNYGHKGHEYWLREFKGGSIDGNLFKATLNYPAADSNEEDKDYTNTFLWDYYYSRNGYDDANSDDYQENDEHITYYKAGRTYEDYPRMAGGMPYLIGFPSEQYYEFDLSGTFVPKNTAATTPAKLAKQVITFASPTGASIAVSDTETGVTSNGYIFKPNYLNDEIAAGTYSYTMKADGSQYDKVPAAEAVEVSAFRPYFVKASSGGSRKDTRSIVFSSSDQEYEQREASGPQGIKATAGRHKITVSSTMREPVTIRIISPSGLCIATFDLQTGESRETHIVNVGVYIVQSTDGRYTRKLIVK